MITASQARITEKYYAMMREAEGFRTEFLSCFTQWILDTIDGGIKRAIENGEHSYSVLVYDDCLRYRSKYGCRVSLDDVNDYLNNGGAISIRHQLEYVGYTVDVRQNRTPVMRGKKQVATNTDVQITVTWSE